MLTRFPSSVGEVTTTPCHQRLSVKRGDHVHARVRTHTHTHPRAPEASWVSFSQSVLSFTTVTSVLQSLLTTNLLKHF